MRSGVVNRIKLLLFSRFVLTYSLFSRVACGIFHQSCTYRTFFGNFRFPTRCQACAILFIYSHYEKYFIPNIQQHGQSDSDKCPELVVDLARKLKDAAEVGGTDSETIAS